jgi:enoyl-CoA hydratase/carnithine racemase
MTNLPLVSRDSGLVTVTLQNPDRRNALTVEVLQAIYQVANDASEASVLLLRGSGPVFCSGFDMDLVRSQEGYLEQLIEWLSKAIRALRRCPATTLVHVQGAAVAGGCALAMSCDLIAASATARFGYPVHQLGISPAVTLPVLMPAAGGFARRMVTDGRLYGAKLLHERGLVHQLLEEGESTDTLVEQLLNRGTHAAQVTKQWLNELEQAYDDDRFDGPAGL